MLVFLLAWALSGDCGGNTEWVSYLTTHYLSTTPMDRAFEGDMHMAVAAQKCFVNALTDELGQPVGYKAALTNPAAQKRFGSDAPLLGVLLEKMILPNGAKTTLAFGSRPMLEGDLVVRVGDEKINLATNEAEVLAALDAVFPFIELADLVYSPETPLSAPAIVAVNTGARAGVLGEKAPIDSARWLNGLANLNVEMLDENGKVLASGKTAALLGHPLKAVMWIRDAVVARGSALKKGDLLSLGSVTPPVFLKQPGSATLRYSGPWLKDDLHVTVHLSGD